MIMISSLMTRVARRFLLEFDVLRWKKAVRHLTRQNQTSNSRQKTFLVCDLLAMIGGVKTEVLFSWGMALQGYKPVVLLNHAEPILEKLYRAVLVNVEFVYFDTYCRKVDQVTQNRKVEALLKEYHGHVHGLLSFEVDGIRVGKNALSLAIRKLRVGKIDLSDPHHLNEVRNAFSYSMTAAVAAQKLILDIQPERALFNERGYTPAGEVFDACILSGCDAIQWIGAPREDELMFKRYNLSNRSVHPLSLSDEVWEKVSKGGRGEHVESIVLARIFNNYDEGASYNRQKLQDGKKLVSRDEVIQNLSIDPSKKTAVIFTHILYDATFFYGESLFEDYQHWLIETVRSAIKNSALNWVIKVHPVNVWRSKMDDMPMEQLEVVALRNEFGELPDHIRIMPADTQINTGSLFDVIDYALTVRGTIGMELPCLGIPVVTAGSGRYSGHGFTIDPQNVHEFSEQLATLHMVPPLTPVQKKAAQQYYFATMFLRPTAFSSFDIDYEAYSYGLKDLAVDCTVVPKVDWGQDLKKLSAWISSDSSQDFLTISEQ